MVNENIEKKELVIDFDGGIVEGKQKVKSKSVVVVATATSESIYSLGINLSGLSDNALLKIKSRELALLTEV